MASQFKDTTVSGQLTANTIILNSKELKIPSSSAQLATKIEDDNTNSTLTPTAKQVRDYIQSKAVTNTHSINLESSNITNVILSDTNTGITFKYTATSSNGIDHTGWIVMDDTTNWNETRQSTKFISEMIIPNTAGVNNFSKLTINGTVEELTSDSGVTGTIQAYKGNLRLSNSDSTVGKITLQTGAYLNTFTGNGTIVNFDGSASDKVAITNYTNVGRITNMKGGRLITNFGEDNDNGAAEIDIGTVVNGTIDVGWANLYRRGTNTNKVTIPSGQTVTYAVLDGTIGTASGSAIINSFTGSYTLKSGLVNSAAPGTIIVDGSKYLGTLELKSSSNLSTLNSAGTISLYKGTGNITDYTNTGAISNMTGTRTISKLGTASNTLGGISITDNTYGTVSLGTSDRGKVGIINIGPSSATAIFAKVEAYKVTIGGTQVTVSDSSSSDAGKLITTSASFNHGSISGNATIGYENLTIGSTDTGVVVSAGGKASASAAKWKATSAGWLSAVSAGTTQSDTAIGETNLTGSSSYVQTITIPSGKSFGSADTVGASVNGAVWNGEDLQTAAGKLYVGGSGELHNKCTNLYLDGALATVWTDSSNYTNAKGSIKVASGHTLNVLAAGNIYVSQPNSDSDPNGTVYNKCTTLYLEGDQATVYTNSTNYSTGTGSILIPSTNQLSITNNGAVYVSGDGGNHNKNTALYLDGNRATTYCSATSSSSTGSLYIPGSNKLGVTLATNATLYLNGWTVTDNGTTISFS